MYKDIGRQGLVSVRPDTPYRRRFDDFVAKKNRLAADQWGSDGIGVAEVTQPVQDLIAREFPDFDPYPWGRFDWVRTLLLNITIAQPLAHEYASRFRGLDDTELDALADSFAFESCAVREPLLARTAARPGPGGRGQPVKAAVLREIGAPLRLEDVELDEPRAGEVLVRIEAAGVCHSDLHYMTGDLLAKLPLVVGHEGAGIVEAVGPASRWPGVGRRPGGAALAAPLRRVRGLRGRQPGALPVRPGARDDQRADGRHHPPASGR